ncbi:MAG: tRNA uridine-5-carboxymethylaminomethyl(34) synthesis enzyme MnmG [Phycisphaeraceae bacterium]|nr:tRNA uridine-5-carboxymethylaminomethyl(34) synthesis enzyme MnmG [Phycisphaeraceae bacterium]
MKGLDATSTHRPFEVIVIGGGHAGVEAAWVAANMLAGRGEVALITMDPAKIGAMSCNPAIGGLAKGQMVREIDALGGVMGLAADATGIQFRMLNMSKGAAVRGPRAQCDRHAYAREVQRLLGTRPNLAVIAGTVEELIVERGEVRGVRIAAAKAHSSPSGDGAHAPCGAPQVHCASTSTASEARASAGSETVLLSAKAVILTTGTFMRALMHTGDRRVAGGRVGEGSAVGIAAALRALGFELGRLKTGTPPRLARASIDWDALPAQPGDTRPVPFSDLSPTALIDGRFPVLPQVECRETRTSAAIHELIRANLHRAPMFSGQVDAECGPRYCPSIEDKVVRFADRAAHHVFLEPESLETSDIYCNGISTSLPEEIQLQIVRALPGCSRAEIVRYGYAVEYDMVWPHQIDATGETKLVRSLYLAGQINGTSGYEEAAAQGCVAGINAARRALGSDPVRFGRDEAYLGVLMDDLVTRTPREPYRMFTSRAEHRLRLRADTTDERLTPRGRDLGTVCDLRWRLFGERQCSLAALREAMRAARVDSAPLVDWIRRAEPSANEVLRHLSRADAGSERGDRFTACASLDNASGPASPITVEQAHAERLRLVERLIHDLRYEGYLRRQDAEIRRLHEAERMLIPEALEPSSIRGLRREAVEVLGRFRPRTMGQASRLAGVNPADMSLLAVAIERQRRRAP